MRVPMTRLVVAAVTTISTVACGQAAPTSPSLASAPNSTPSTSSGLVTPRAPSPPPIEPLLARLNLVTNHLLSANHQLEMYLLPVPPPIVPPNPLFLENALDFYLKANDVLGAISAPTPPPIVPEWTEALNGIIGQANTTLSRLNSNCDACGPQPPPIFQNIIDQAHLITSLATAMRGSSGE